MSGLTLTLRMLALGILAITVISLAVAQTTANTVATSRASDTSQAITPDTLKPAICAGITLTALVTGNGNIDPGIATINQLILGGSAAQTFRARGGDDCLLAGGGNDTIRCDAGTDVADGGPGTDSFNADCETQVN